VGREVSVAATSVRPPVTAPPEPEAPSTGTGRAARVRAAVLPDRWGWLMAPLLVFLLLVFVAPLAAILARSFTDPELGLQNYRAFFASPVYADVLVNTFRISGLVTLLTLVLGFPYAYLMTLATPF
jgi:putative spermidine/putrescine transport system permease protein